jgi:hypothetical protein
MPSIHTALDGMSSTPPPPDSDPQVRHGPEETKPGGDPPDVSGPAPDAATIADILLEIRETNKLLRALVTQKASFTNGHQQPGGVDKRASGKEGGDVDPQLPPAPVESGATPGLEAETRDRLWTKAHQLTDDMIRAVFEMDRERAVRLRDDFFELLRPDADIQSHIDALNPESPNFLSDYTITIPLLLTPTDGVVWSSIPRMRGSYLPSDSPDSELGSDEVFPPEIRAALKAAWPLAVKIEWQVQFGSAVLYNGPTRSAFPPAATPPAPATAPTSTPSSAAPPPDPLPALRPPWMFNFRHKLYFLCTPLCPDPNGRLFPAFSALDDRLSRPEGIQSEMTRQASLWWVWITILRLSR